MGQSVFPAPVVSTTDTWTLIQTNTTTSGATSTFSGLSGYRKYMIAWDEVSTDTDGSIKLTFNSSTTKYFGGWTLRNSVTYHEALQSSIALSYPGNSFRTLLTGYTEIENITNGLPKKVKSELNGGDTTWVMDATGGWVNTAAITSIVFTAGGGGAFSAGTMRLYGVAA